MQEIEYHDVDDKSRWPDGPWKQEPDKKQWRDAATGLPCLIVRARPGALCGYVGVSRDHPFYGLDYDNEVIAVEVHGGLTFASKCQEHGREGDTICHKVEPGEDDDVWWLGFDCSHPGDLCPSHDLLHRYPRGTYKDIAFVTREVEALARQLVEHASND
jgi:hypothetical protein